MNKSTLKTTKALLTASLVVLGAMSAIAQEQFTVATLNIDGLPKKILSFEVNPDGPGDAGTARIGKYLMKKGYDMVLMQEDFNFHDVLTVFLEDDYLFDTWSGSVDTEEDKEIDYLHLQNYRFSCDGLMACWKNDITMNPMARTAWEQNFGKFSHANDEMVTKGFRRYDVTLRSGVGIVVYNMHMDASDDEDIAARNDTKDKAARMAQWEQLKEDVLQHLDTRPVIIVGDMNSYYGRDNVKEAFIDAINLTGRGSVSDVWVELQQRGVYPTTLNEESTEALDKILYINPASGSRLRAIDFNIDKDNYQYDGNPLGDHYPLVATFDILSTTTGITESDSHGSGVGNEELYNFNGQHVGQPRQKGVYIRQRNGEKSEKLIIK